MDGLKGVAAVLGRGDMEAVLAHGGIVGATDGGDVDVLSVGEARGVEGTNGAGA